MEITSSQKTCHHPVLPGKSPIKQHMEGIGLAMAAQEFASRYYGSGGNVGGVLSTDRSLTNEQYSA